MIASYLLNTTFYQSYYSMIVSYLLNTTFYQSYYSMIVSYLILHFINLIIL